MSGSISETKEGTFQVRVTVDGKRKQLGKVQPTREAAEALLLVFNHQKAAKDYSQGLTLDLLLADYVIYLRGIGRRNVKNVESFLRNWVCGHVIGRLPIKAITVQDCRDWLGWLVAQECKTGICQKVSRGVIGSGSVANIKSALGAMLRWCVEIKGLIAVNPMREVQRELAPVEDRRNWLCRLDVEKLLTSDVDARFRNLYAFAIGTAMRAGEIFCLHLADIDLTPQKILGRYVAPHGVITIRYGGRKNGALHLPKGLKVPEVQ